MTIFDTPILFLVFNRPDHTAKVFARIREIKPTTLFVAADGPRNCHPDDRKKCELVRKIILEGVDWTCEVKTLFRDKNLGCGLGVSTAITWFFENVQQGIILEDDCLPDISFFDFCRTLLQYYQDDHRVMHISGDNFQRRNSKNQASYYFSAYPHIWGWATWRRSWKAFDYIMADYNQSRIEESMKWYGFKKEEIDHWSPMLAKQSLDSRIDTWDYQWLYAVWKNNGLSVLPNANLVKNIGFDNEATHTKITHSGLLNLPLHTIGSLIHPKNILVNRRADLNTFKTIYFDGDTALQRIKNKFQQLNFIKGFTSKA